MPAPIIVFAYNRPDYLAKALTALAANREADQSKLFIFCDGPKLKKDEAAYWPEAKTFNSVLFVDRNSIAIEGPR